MAFLRGEADVLVSTSIIESGIDIPQANTLIVDRADLFGLSQLYQIRGPRRPLPRARLRVPALSERRGADGRGRRPPVRALGLHRARRGLQGRDARPRAARRRQPARRRAVRPRRRARLRALHADARRGRARDGSGRGGCGAARAGASGHQRRRLRPGGLHPVRAGQGRRAPPDRRRARELRARRAARSSSRTASARSRSRSRT